MAILTASVSSNKTRTKRNSGKHEVLAVDCCGDGHEDLGPAQIETISGQRSRQLLIENSALFQDNLAAEFKSLATSEQDDSLGLPPPLPDPASQEEATSQQELLDLLQRRIKEVRNSERGHAKSELLYLMVCDRFREVRVRLTRSLKEGGRAVLELRHYRESALTLELHKPEVLAAIEEHVARTIPSATSWTSELVQLPLFSAGQVYAMSLLYGYVLERALARLQLERQLGLLVDQQTGDGHSLTTYLDSIGPGPFQDMMVSLEAHVAAELQVSALFGDLLQLKGDLRDKVSSRAISKSNVKAALEEVVASGEVKSLQLTFQEFRRLLLEALAFGSLLRLAEVQAQQLGELTAAPSCRLSQFGVDTDREGNPIVPPV